MYQQNNFLTGFLVVSASELGLLLSVEMSADSALLVLVVLGKFDVGGVSVEFNSDVIEFNNDNLVLLVDTGLLELLDSLDLLSIDGHTHLLGSLVHLKFDDGFATDDLHLLLLSILRDLLEKNGEFGFLRRAILGENGVASGQRSTEDDVIERVDLAGLNGAHSLGLFDKVRSEGGKGTDGSHRLTTDVHKTKGYGKTEITDGNLLGRSLEGQVGILTSRGLDGKKSTDDSLLVVSEFIDVRNHLGVDVESLEKRTSHGAGDIVLGENLVLVEHGSFNETSVFLEGVGSPARLDVDGEFTVLLLEKLLKSLGHLGVEHLDGRFNLPVAGFLLKKRGVSQLLVTDGSEVDFNLALHSSSNSLDLSPETVRVGLVGLVRLDVVVERRTTLLLISIVLLVFLSLEVLLIVLLEEFLHRRFLHSRFLIESRNLSLDHVFLGGLRGLLERDLQIVLSDEKSRGNSLGSFLPDVSMDVSFDIHAKSGRLLEMGRADLVNESLEFLNVDGLLLGLNVDTSLLGPDTNEGDGTSLELNNTTGLLGKGEGRLVVELLVPAHFGGHVNGNIDGSRVEELHSKGNHGEVDLNLGDVSGGKSGTGLDTNAKSIKRISISGLKLDLDRTVNLEDGGHLGREDQRRSHGSGNGTSSLVDERREDGVETESLSEERFDLSEFDSSIAKDGLDHLGDNFLIDGEKSVVHITESDVDEGMRIMLRLLARDDGELGEESTKDLSGLEGRSLSSDKHLFESALLNLLENLVENLVDVVLMNSDLSEVLVPLSRESSLKGSHDFSREDRVVREEGRPVKGGSVLVLLIVDSPVLEVTRIVGVTKLERLSHLGGRLIVELESDLVNHTLLRDSVHNLVEGSNTDLGIVSDGLESKNLLISGLSSFEFLDKFSHEILLDVTRALSLLRRFDGELVTMISTHSVHKSSSSQPARLTLERLTTRILAKRDERLDNLLRGNTDGSELLEKSGGLEGRELKQDGSNYLASANLLNEVLDSVERAGKSKSIVEDFLHLRADGFLLRLGRALLLHLDNDRLDKTSDNFVLVLDLGERRFLEERLVSGSKVLLLLLLPFHRIKKSFLLLTLRGGDSLLFLVHFDKSHVSRDESGEESLLLRQGSIRVDGSEFDLLDHETGRSSGDTVVEDGGRLDVTLLSVELVLAGRALISETEVVSLSNTTRALLEVDRLGNEKLRFLTTLTTRRRFRKNGVDNFAISLEGHLRMRAEKTFSFLDSNSVLKRDSSCYKLPYLEHVDVDSLDVHRPGEILTVEFNVRDHSILVTEANGQTKSTEYLSYLVEFDLLEKLERLDLLRLIDFLLEGSNADLLESQMSDSLGFGEGKGDEGLGTDSRLLRAGNGKTVADLRYVVVDGWMDTGISGGKGRGHKSGD
ncbi:hypothetical protein PRIPAC_96826 [Pristionchus pacificus]|uniref:Uncharacterized protein n=1 Tax=Pristionchus pacificus TaxID=54126 RepID=A0A2A6BBU8_PRIPA|nr:hypothetical protein PRIPAC_96826 [Pristionchus pacificus]|eukprot:PDM63349.1 hypothetical protein PRIPAC_53706 [Pristionchus pacificus]